jgi:hypothetical protein
MKATLHFDLPDDELDWTIHKKADDMYLALHDMHNELRAQWKYGEHDVVRTDRVWERFHAILGDNGIDITREGL